MADQPQPMNVVATVNILDRGDGPAQEVLNRTARNRAQRAQDETRVELNKITDRVEKTLGHFDSTVKAEEEAKANKDPNTTYVSDIDELYDILGDQIKKRKYQQQVTVFVVGYQNTCNTRLKLIQQVNEFFNDTTHRWEEEELNPSTPDVDLDEVQQSVNESLDTARDLTNRISELNKEMVDYMYQYANAKAGNKNRKKLEKALSQAKEDVQMMSERLLAVQKDLEEKDDKIQSLYRQVEVKTMEAQRFKTAAEVAKEAFQKSLQENNARDDEKETKEREIKDLQKKVDMLTIELAQKDASRETTQKELLTAGREQVLKIKELEDKLSKTSAENQAQQRDLNDYHDRQLTNLANAHRQEINDLKSSYEGEIDTLKALKSELESIDTGVKVQPDFSKEVRSKAGTRKKGKASETIPDEEPAKLEPVPAEVNLPDDFPDEGKWSSYPMNQAQSAFSQYRDFTQNKVKALQEEVDQVEQKTDKKVLTLKGQFHEHKIKWHAERSLLVQQIELSQRLMTDAEKDADGVLAQLEEFVVEAEQLEKEEEGNALKRQAQTLAAKKPDTPEVAAAPLDDSLLQQTDDAKSLRVSETSGGSPQLLMQVTSAEGTRDQSDEVNPSPHKSRESSAPGQGSESSPHGDEVEELPHVEDWDPRQSSASDKKGAIPVSVSQGATPVSVSQGATPASERKESCSSEVELQEEAELRSRDGAEQSEPSSRKGRRSVTFNEEAVRQHSSSIKSAFSERHKVFERIISNLKSMMSEDGLDVVQMNALEAWRSTIKPQEGDEEAEEYHPEHTLMMFGLASQISAESVYLGYKPDSMFSTILSMYYRSVEEYNATVAKLAEESEKEEPTISDLTKLLAAEMEKSPVPIMLKPGTPDSYAPLPEETDSAKVRLASAGAVGGMDSPLPQTPTTIASRAPEVEGPDSGRSTPHSRLSSKYRASISSARQSIAERRSTSPRLVIPDVASFEDAELDENAEYPAPTNKHERSTSIGSSLHLEGRISKRDKSTAVSSAAHSTAPLNSATTRQSSTKSLAPGSSVVSIPIASDPHTPAISVYDKTTSVTPKFTADRPTSYSINKTPTLNEEQLVSSEDLPETGDPVLDEYMRLYNSILLFKDGLAKILLDKDMMSPSQQILDMEPIQIDIEAELEPQVKILGESCARLLMDCGAVVNDALTAAFREDYNVSSVVSRGTSHAGGTRPESYGMAPVPPTTSPETKNRKSAESIRRASPAHSANKTPLGESGNFSDIQERLHKMQIDFDQEVQNHQDDVNHNTAIVMELQDTVAELRRELAQVKEQAESREQEQAETESPIMFTRLDAERNAKNLKRALNNNKLSEERYHEAVEKMDAYVSLPAKRFAELVKKYVHHRNMMRIEDTIKNRQELDDSDMDMLERMETLQNMRTKRWMDKMDELADRRSELATELMASLEELEQESGIFMIKPMFSYRAFLTAAKQLKPKKSKDPAAQQHPTVINPVQHVPQANYQMPPEGRWVSTLPRTGGTWDLSSSVPGNSDLGFQHLINTPRILELDVNRMMYGQNQVSMKSNPYLSHDRLVNAANSSTRSYMTVSRPVPGQHRPSSSGAIATSKSLGGLPEDMRRSDSAEANIRLRTTPPLPPISRNNTSGQPGAADRQDTGRDSSVNPSRLARDFTDDSIHTMPTHVTKIITMSNSVSREELLEEEPTTA